MEPKTEIAHITTPVAKYTLDFNTGVIKANPIITHGDSIRAMSNDELAEFINGVEAEAIRRAGLFITVGDIQRGKEGWLDWLKKEVSHD